MNISNTVEITLHTGGIPPEDSPRGRKVRSAPVTNEDLEPDEQQTLASWEDRMFFDAQQAFDVYSYPQPNIVPPTNLELLREELDRRLGDIREKFMRSLVSTPAAAPKAKDVAEETQRNPELEEVFRRAFANLPPAPPELKGLALLSLFMRGDDF